ncbi:hypothetical protein K449DRAFT_463008 [Hypoxylon sp. EC38]|nr:hypothetical protein K449DRAFT_463008 [Hypoxylon sp. EC38]
MSNKDTISQEFTSYYLQQSTKEFAEDLDKIRSADDFKGYDSFLFCRPKKSSRGEKDYRVREGVELAKPGVFGNDEREVSA